METLLKVIFVFGTIFLIAIIMTIPVYFLWNWLMPEIFDLKEITLLQAFGLNLLTSGLFKSTNSSES